MACWRRFLETFLAWTLLFAGGIYGFVLLVDPYDSLPFSPGFEREPISTNQRYSFPALARKPHFDSAVIGTSTTRLLEPARLNGEFGGAFVNLSMNDSTTYEQFMIFSLFVRHHPAPRTVIFGIDREWCATEIAPRFTFRPFPPWLYDDNRWNDLLYLFNFDAIEQAGRQLGRLTGLRAPRYGLDGYTSFLPPAAAYDVAKAKDNLYGPGVPHKPKPAIVPTRHIAIQPGTIDFPQHPRMHEMLASLPGPTLKVLFFVPYHHHSQPPPGSLGEAIWQECKTRLAAMLPDDGTGHALDFMIRSAITMRDENYWDPVHYSTAVAEMLVELTALGVRGKRGRENYFRYLR